MSYVNNYDDRETIAIGKVVIHDRNMNCGHSFHELRYLCDDEGKTIAVGAVLIHDQDMNYCRNFVDFRE